VDPGSTSVQVTVCESSTSLHIKKFGDPVDNVIKFWKDSPNDVSSPTLIVICPAVVGVTLAEAATVSVPIEKVDTLVDGLIDADPVTDSMSLTLALNDDPLTKGEPTFTCPVPLIEAMGCSDTAP
jgi:hypothetical protein